LAQRLDVFCGERHRFSSPRSRWGCRG
jgi:hypothetical protein